LTFRPAVLRCVTLADLEPSVGRKPTVILAGIDEAGYGPRLGPLVVAGSTFRTTAAQTNGGGWPECRFLSEPGLVRVSDSKAAYSPTKGLEALEAAVLGFAAAGGQRPEDLAAFLKTYAVEGAREALRQAWYASRNPRLPLAVAAAALDAISAAVTKGLAEAGLEHLWSRFAVVDEVRYNELVLRTGNKAMVLFGRNAILMRRMWEDYAAEGVYLTVDRHGGRKFYAGLLDMAFPDAGIKVLGETDDESAYLLTASDGRAMHVRFLVHAETADSAVALSSMWAKYVREIFMRLFNDYWVERAGGIKPTAGYWVDGERFLADLRASGVVTDAEAERFTRWK